MKHSVADVQAALLHIAVETLARAPEPYDDDVKAFVHTLLTANPVDVAERLRAA